MEYFFDRLPVELRMDGRTGAVREASGYVEILPDTTTVHDTRTSNWTLGHVMIRCGDHMLFADTWTEAQIKMAILQSDGHVDRIRAMWGQSQRDMRAAFSREAAYA